MYGPTAWFLKVSLLLVSIRVFNFDRRFVIFWYAFIAAMALYYVPVLFIKANICHPIGGFWDSSIPTRCLSQRIVFVADTTISAVTDTAVLLAPVPVIRALRLPPMAKMRVYLLLGAGGVATIASCIRMYLVIDLYLGTQSGSGSQTVDFVKFNLLGYVLRLPWREHMQLIIIYVLPYNRTAELAIGVVCACMPTLNLLYQSRDNHSERNRPRTTSFGRAYRFLKRKPFKRSPEWWSDGTTVTQNTQPEAQGGEALATIRSDPGTELISVPSSTTKPSRLILWQHHSSATPAVAPSLSPQPLSPTSPRVHFSGRFSRRSGHMSMGPQNSRNRSPPRRLDHGITQQDHESPPEKPRRLEAGRCAGYEADATAWPLPMEATPWPVPIPADSEETPLSPIWPFVEPQQTIGDDDRISEASCEPCPTLSPTPWRRNTFGRT